MNQIGEGAVSTYTIKTNEYVNNFISDKSNTDFNGPNLAQCIISSALIYR
jgi:hypothetical protein